MKRRLLILSDDPVLQGFFHRNFREECYPVMATPDTDEALRTLLDRMRPDLVMLDIGMPRLDGIEVCLRIRQMSEVPVMMLSTWGAASGEVKGLDLGSDSYLTESFGVTRLKAQIDEALGANAQYQLSCQTAGSDNGG